MRVRTVWQLVCLSALAMVCAGATTSPTPAASSQPASTPGALLSFPTWGIEFTSPAGWKRVAESDFTVIASFVPADGSDGMLRVIAIPVMQNSIGDLARAIAKRVGGKVTADALGGRVAQRVSSGRNGEASLVSQRSGYIFEVLYQRRPPAHNPVDLDAVRETWKWIEQSPPYKQTAQRTDPIEALGTITIRPQEHIRPWPIAKSPPGHMTLAAVDVGSQRILKEFEVDISMPPEIQGRSLRDISENYSTALADEFKTRRRPGFSNVGDRADRLISQTVPELDAAGKLKRASIKGVAALDDQRRVLLNFSITTTNGDALAAFALMAGAIVESVEPIKTGATSQPAH